MIVITILEKDSLLCIFRKPRSIKCCMIIRQGNPNCAAKVILKCETITNPSCDFQAMILDLVYW